VTNKQKKQLSKPILELKQKIVGNLKCLFPQQDWNADLSEVALLSWGTVCQVFHSDYPSQEGQGEDFPQVPNNKWFGTVIVNLEKELPTAVPGQPLPSKCHLITEPDKEQFQQRKVSNKTGRAWGQQSLEIPPGHVCFFHPMWKHAGGKHNQELVGLHSPIEEKKPSANLQRMRTKRAPTVNPTMLFPKKEPGPKPPPPAVT
jgi:hypothetical protein